GKLTVDSSLDQPLSAQIEVTSAGAGKLDTLAVKVADPSLYRQNNLAYNGALSRARVTVERRPSGEAYLKVVTSTAINEPYLDLMVELNWASGRLVREYTFLLDPPGVTPTPVEPVAPVRLGVPPPRPPAEAVKVVRMQAADWRAYRDRVAAAAPATEATASRAAGGRIGTAVVDSVPAAPPGRDQLKVSRDAGGAKGAAATEESIARDR